LPRQPDCGTLARMQHSYLMRVPFGDVDHAGIAYYPRVFHYFHVAYEDFFHEVLKMPFQRFFEEGRGAPIVRCEADFLAPLAHGMKIEVRCWIEKLGNRSWTWIFEIRDTEDPDAIEPRVRGRVTKVFVDLDTMKSEPLDPKVRALVLPYVEEPSAPAAGEHP